MLIILMGKSGCGKSTIEKYFPKMISFTTRLARENEVHGRDYYFYDKDEVEREIPKFKNGEKSFIRQLSTYGGNFYGTSQEEVDRILSQDLTIAVMNLEGSLDMKRIFESEGGLAKIIWVDIDEEIRLKRLMERMNDTGEDVEKIKERLNEDYRNEEIKFADYVLTNNGSLEEAVGKINDLVKSLRNN